MIIPYIIISLLSLASARSLPFFKDDVDDGIIKRQFDPFVPPFPTAPAVDELISRPFTKNLTFQLGGAAKYPIWPLDARKVAVEVTYGYTQSSAPFVGSIGMVTASGKLVSSSHNITTLETAVAWSESERTETTIQGTLSLTFTFYNSDGEALFEYRVQWNDTFFIGKEKGSWSEVIDKVTLLAGTCKARICQAGGHALHKSDFLSTITPMTDCVGGPNKCPKRI